LTINPSGDHLRPDLADTLRKLRKAAGLSGERLAVRCAMSQAKISRMTGELETRTRTMQIEINIDNTEGFLVAGSFAYITLHIPIQSYPQIPVSGLLVRGTETLVATVENDTLRYRPVRVASTAWRIGCRDLSTWG